MCIVRKGHPVLFTSWKEIIPTKVLRTTGMEEADDSPLPPNFSQPTGKSYWWQSSGWVSGWNNSWLERNKLCLKSQGAVLTSWKPFQTALVWKDQLWYRSGKGLKTITNPPNHSPVPEALHRSCSILQRSCWGSFVSIQAKSGFFLLSCIHIYSSEFLSHHAHATLTSCGHCPAKKRRCKLCWVLSSP